jgi:hypothetical protein
MHALFIGQTYIDVTFLTDRMPTGDEKHVASAYAVSFGGNAVTAAFCCAKLGGVPDLLTTVADDWLGRMFLDMAASLVAVVHYAERWQACDRTLSRRRLSAPLPQSASLKLPRASPGRPPAGCRNSLRNAVPRGESSHIDGGGLRSNTHQLLGFIDVAIMAERLCEQMGHEPVAMLDYLKSRDCRIGGVTLGERGLVWYDETGMVRTLPAFKVPPDRMPCSVIDAMPDQLLTHTVEEAS